MSRDLLLRGGRILDPASGRDEIGDLLLIDGMVAAVGGHIAPAPRAEVLRRDRADRDAGVDRPAHPPARTGLRVQGDDSGRRASPPRKAGSPPSVACRISAQPPIPRSKSPTSSSGRAARRSGCCRSRTITRGRALEEPVDFAALAAAGAIGFSDDGESTRSDARDAWSRWRRARSSTARSWSTARSPIWSAAVR